MRFLGRINNTALVPPSGQMQIIRLFRVDNKLS